MNQRTHGQDLRLRLADLLGRRGRGITRAIEAAAKYLRTHSTPALLDKVGSIIPSVPRVSHLDKKFFQASYRGDMTKPPDDLLTGFGLFYITEQRRLFLDCTAGHYQMTWGYNHPAFNALLTDAMKAGVVWDDHSNIPGNTVKRLAERLVQAANDVMQHSGTRMFSDKNLSALVRDKNALNTVLLGICTGSVAASSALKIALKHHEAVRPGVRPTIVTINGNYHGTDFFAQRLRGMWTDYFTGVKVVQIEPNDVSALRKAFHANHGSMAAFFAEPILMNREAILLEPAFMREARALCNETDACMILDEIQTGFWCPEIFMYHQYGLLPDILIIGKGMTAGFHPLSAIVYKGRYDRLAQYDAISTNGNAPLAALAGLACLDLIVRNAERIEKVSQYYFAKMLEIPSAYPDRVAGIHGKGFMAGIKFRKVQDALDFHKRCLARGLWTRVHAYHEGHSTVLTKLGLLADTLVANFVVERFRQILEEMGHG